MTRVFRFGPVLSACLALGACAQLVGLDKFDDKGGEAGSPASGGKSGAGGSAGQAQGAHGGQGGTGGGAAGKAGKAGSGGNAGSEAGAGAVGGTGVMPGSGGNVNAPGGAGGMQEGGAAGTGATGGTRATGGTGGGSGGTVGNGGAGAGGESPGGCSTTIEITPHGAPTLDDETSASIPYYDYQYDVDPQIGSPASDYLWLDFYTSGGYDGDATGLFHLGTGDEENYATCSRCVYLGQDVGSSSIKAFFFAKSGTLDIAADSKQMQGKPDLTLSDVLLTEVTIDTDTNVSTEVPGGRCLHLASLTLTTTSVPAGWTCPSSAYGTEDGCDCGCGVVDPDCFSQYVGACDYCSSSDDAGSCASDCTDIDLNDNSKCATDQGWTCDPAAYGDGESCDCGCGVVDYDCFDATVGSCDTCDDTNSCTMTRTSSCNDIDPVDNSKCN
ncbi:MAG TPA: hypothetical protein VMI54_15015 [Polyangiaceae bacterium]|nr:hypothetical protein [Polyangiaceae bacterium]